MQTVKKKTFVSRFCTIIISCYFGNQSFLVSLSQFYNREKALTRCTLIILGGYAFGALAGKSQTIIHTLDKMMIGRGNSKEQEGKTLIK